MKRTVEVIPLGCLLFSSRPADKSRKCQKLTVHRKWPKAIIDAVSLVTTAMSKNVRLREQYLDYKPPVILYRSLPLLLRYVPEEYLADLHTITLTNSAALRKTGRGKVSWEKRRVRPADCRGLYGRGNIILVVDQMFIDCPELLLALPPVKMYLIARTLYHEIGHHIHRLEQPGYRAERETFADEWRDKLVRDFMRRRYWYFGLLVRACAKLFPSLNRDHDAPSSESVGNTA